MNNAAIIDYNNNFNLFNEFLFFTGKINDKKIVNYINIENNNIMIINFPATAKSLLNKKKLNVLLYKFGNYLKNKNIEKIIFSDEAAKIINLTEYLSERFYIFNGKNVINEKFEYIINKCFNFKKSDKIILYSNSLNLLNNYFDSLLNKFREISIITSYKNMFVSFTDEIFNDYGININIYNYDEYIVKENDFIINIDTENEDLYYDMDLRKIKLIFLNNIFYNKVKLYFREFNEKVLEFIIYNLYGIIEKSIINEFFNDYNIRIVKIYKK